MAHQNDFHDAGEADNGAVDVELEKGEAEAAAGDEAFPRSEAEGVSEMNLDDAAEAPEGI